MRIKPLDPLGSQQKLKKPIKKRKRAYKKAKHTNSPAHWANFKRISNKVTSMIRASKQNQTDKIANKLKLESLSSRSWWTILKSFISSSSKSTVPPIEQNGTLYTEAQEKADLLNTFFCEQTMLNAENAVLPNITPYVVTSHLADIVLNPSEVKSVLKTLATGKASGPNGLNNSVIKELANEISDPLCSLFNYSLSLCSYPTQ